MSKSDPSNRRKYPRVINEAVVSLRRLDSTPSLAHGLDVGVGGIRFQCVGLDLDLNESVEVTFNLGDCTESVVGQIVRITELDAFTQEIALAFLHVEPETLERFYEVGLASDDEGEL